MDSISWKSSSVLWECMEKENYQIPANKDVEQRAEIAGVTPLKGDSVPNTPNGTRGKLIVREGGWRKIILFSGRITLFRRNSYKKLAITMEKSDLKRFI